MRRLSIVTLIVSILILASSPVALAGSDGQQLAFSPGCWSNWAHIRGLNQHNHYVSQWFQVPAAPPEYFCIAEEVYDVGWWWKGEVEIEAYWEHPSKGRGTRLAGKETVEVPEEQPEDDWTYVSMPGG
jgi:hypothetical protein